MLYQTHKVVETRWTDDTRQHLETRLNVRRIRDPGPNELRVSMSAFAVHGSFWKATDPRGTHPRLHEFMRDGGFVFGNGGAGRVLAVGDRVQDVVPGDTVAFFGHLGCQRVECRACRAGLFVECDFGESTIIGHGGGASPGTYAEQIVVRREAVEVCFAAHQPPSRQQLLRNTYAFLLADIQNTLARFPSDRPRGSILLVGAGLSGHLAAHLLLELNPSARLLVADKSAKQLASIRRLDPNRVTTFRVANGHESTRRARRELGQSVRSAFRSAPDLVLDCSSGHTAPMWLNTDVLGPSTMCLIFGFGSPGLQINSALMQLSGLSIGFCRGVGSRTNRRAALRALATQPAGQMVDEFLVGPAQLLHSLDQFVQLVDETHRNLRGETPSNVVVLLEPNETPGRRS